MYAIKFPRDQCDLGVRPNICEAVQRAQAVLAQRSDGFWFGCISALTRGYLGARIRAWGMNMARRKVWKMDKDLREIARGTSVLIACMAQTLNETDPTFEQRYLDRVARAYGELRDNSDVDEGLAFSMLRHVRSLLTGFDIQSGQGKPFLGD